MQLSEIIIQKIRSEGPVSFRDYMEMALYYPDLGYYTSEPAKTGMNGDYYTTPYLTSEFGALIARQLEEMWALLGHGPFTVVEFGAGSGFLCHDILNYLKSYSPLYDSLNYYIVERSPVMLMLEKKHLHEKVTWYNSILEVPGITGCVLSNELVDNFPVHQVLMQQQLMEIFVNYENDFKETLKPAGRNLTDYFAELQVTLPKGFRTEANLDALTWLKGVSCFLKRGYVITVDYGHPSSVLYSNSKKDGTLISYRNHEVNENLYEHIGQQDITSHVNFSALSHWGLKFGLEYQGLIDQSEFLLNLGLTDSMERRNEMDHNIIEAAKQRAFLMHMLLVDMGKKFKVLIQSKEAPNCKLRSLRKSLHDIQ